MNVLLEKRNDISVDTQTIKDISGAIGVNKKLVELLFLRGMKTEKDVHDFLFPDAGNFYDPFLMKGMREAVDRINAAIENDEKIVGVRRLRRRRNLLQRHFVAISQIARNGSLFAYSQQNRRRIRT